MKQPSPGTWRIHVRYADVGLPRPGRYSSDSFHIDRAVAQIRPLEGSAQGAAEQGEIRFQHRAVTVYRCIRAGAMWTTDRVDVMKTISITYLR